LIKKAIAEIIFDIITVAVFGAAIVALMYISNKMQPHKHTDKCLIEEKTK
jgi:hypothetical protein